MCNPATGLPIESNNARLLKSVITAKYLVHGFQDHRMTLNVDPMELHDPTPTANSVQLQVDPQDIYIIDSENDEPMTVDAEEIEVIDISIDEEDEVIECDDLIQL